jgi:hypothetical protein
MGRKRAKVSDMRNSVRSIVLAPEKIDLLLHGQVLKNPPLPKEKVMIVKKTLGEQLREKLDEAAKRESLNNTLNAWDEDEQKQIKGELVNTTQKHLFGVTNNASRTTFNYVRDNPGLRVGDITKALTAQGYKETTVSSLLYQMVTVGLFRKDGYTSQFFATKPEFEPYNINKIRREKAEEQRKRDAEMLAEVPSPARKVVLIKRRTPEPDANAAGIGALVTTDQPLNDAWRPEDVVDQLTLVQAKAVHAYLQKVFGAL